MYTCVVGGWWLALLTNIVTVSICKCFLMRFNMFNIHKRSCSSTWVTKYDKKIFRFIKYFIILVYQDTFCGGEDVLIWNQGATTKIKIGSIWIRLISSQFSVGRLLKAARCSSHVSKTGNKWWKMVICLIHSRLEVTYGHMIWRFLDVIGFTTPTTWSLDYKSK